MSTEIFSQYADYLAYAADMHRKMAQSFYNLENEISQLDSFLTKNNFQGEDSVKNLTKKIPSTRNNILVNFSQISYVEDFFIALVQYEKKKFNKTTDQMLTDEGLKVFNSYAQVSNSLADPISIANIKQE